MSGSRKRSRNPSSSEDGDSSSLPPPTKRRRDEDLMSLLLAKLSLAEDQQQLKHEHLQSQQKPCTKEEEDQDHQSAVVALPEDAQLPQLADGTTAPAPARPLPRFNFKTRCAYCRRKPKLVIGFTCRCGATFCELHRHPETHHCSFDYKQFGRHAISQANPLILSDKLPCRI